MTILNEEKKVNSIICDLYLDSIMIASGEGAQRKESQQDVYSNAYEVLTTMTPDYILKVCNMCNMNQALTNLSPDYILKVCHTCNMYEVLNNLSPDYILKVCHTCNMNQVLNNLSPDYILKVCHSCYVHESDFKVMALKKIDLFLYSTTAINSVSLGTDSFNNHSIKLMSLLMYYELAFN